MGIGLRLRLQPPVGCQVFEKYRSLALHRTTSSVLFLGEIKKFAIAFCSVLFFFFFFNIVAWLPQA